MTRSCRICVNGDQENPGRASLTVMVEIIIDYVKAILTDD